MQEIHMSVFLWVHDSCFRTSLKNCDPMLYLGTPYQHYVPPENGRRCSDQWGVANSPVYTHGEMMTSLISTYVIRENT